MARNRKDYFAQYRKDHPEKQRQYRRTWAVKMLMAEGYTVIAPQVKAGDQ